MPRFGVYEPEDAVAAWAQLVELDSLAAALDRLGLPTADVEARRRELCSQPVKIRCYRCRRRVVIVPRLAAETTPQCKECGKEACDLLYCFAPGTVAITLGDTTLLRCEGHALALWEHIRIHIPRIRPVWFRHLTTKEAA